MNGPVLQCEAVRFTYASSGFGLSIPSFQVSAGEAVFLEGESGSGKSTALNLMAGVLRADQGQVRLMGQNLRDLSESRVDALRVENIGFIFQQFNVLPYLSVIDNVTLPCRFSKSRTQRALREFQSVNAAAQALLNRLGMGEYITAPVNTLSVGQQQRVAAARAFIGNPALIIADEPTSALDARHQAHFAHLLVEQAGQQGSAVLLVSHDPALATHCSRRESMAQWRVSTSAAS